MTGEPQKVSMDIDSPGGSTGTPYRPQQNGLNLYPVSVNDSGEGLPYAPENFPNPGDKWSWKVGRRIASAGHFLDRYMYPPPSLRRPGPKRGFPSRLSLEQYIRGKFPDVDVNAFFASFSWKIPYKKDIDDQGTPVETVENLESDEVHCKAGNKFCSSLATQEDSVSEVMSCDICCSEPSFCRDCCCILCCRTINNSCGGYSYIRCEANIKGYDCGHISHIDCALRAYMAGTVGGSIGLDAEYYCRRCDSRADLVSHVKKLLENCESIDSRDVIEKILKVGICVLRGSKKTIAKQLLHHIELAMSKLKNGTYLGDIWKKEDVSAATAELSPNTNGGSGFKKYEEDPHDCEKVSPPKLSSNFDHRVESLKLEDEIDHILDRLKKSQAIEYRLAEEKLLAQKNFILNLYQQLDKEKCDLSRHTSSKGQDSLLDAVLNRVNQIKREVLRLKDMEEVAKGFGRVPKHILKEQYGLDIEH
ncbi:hypothetical protein BUALT_Bualt12G0133000 [Buddleja alternifolia]|uniref:Oberon PHD finger domain-containing protein n=1 Tax=Buddleja alternifolia TaxID=168488 RepID=A0AAV6X1J0_9LAMI|nr:hypothetical protein BUALT_Bualt12G0133000 [Buddleja alternifolia]